MHVHVNVRMHVSAYVYYLVLFPTKGYRWLKFPLQDVDAGLFQVLFHPVLFFFFTSIL